MTARARGRLAAVHAVAVAQLAVHRAMRAGQRIVDTTTGDPQDSAAFAAECAGRGVAYLDATVLGSSAQLARREALLLVGGETGAFEDCRPLWNAWTEQVFHLGPPGAGRNSSAHGALTWEIVKCVEPFNPPPCGITGIS